MTNDTIKMLKEISNNKKISVINDVQIITDGDITHFKPINKPIIKKEKQTLWQKFISWCKKHSVRPYIKIRNLADPIDSESNSGEGGKTGIETGIKVEF